MTPQQVYTVEELMRLLKYKDRKSIYNLINRGLLEGFKTFGFECLGFTDSLAVDLRPKTVLNFKE